MRKARNNFATKTLQPLPNTFGCGIVVCIAALTE